MPKFQDVNKSFLCATTLTILSAPPSEGRRTKSLRHDLETEINDLKYQVKELAYRIEERRDVRNDIRYKDLKANLGIYP